MTAKKSGSLSKFFVWIVLLLLIVGLGGFGVTNFSGSVTSVGAVGDEEITVPRYSLALQEELQAMTQQTGQAMSLAQANQLAQVVYGVPLTDRVFAQLVTTAALDNETSRIGISVGDEQVRDQVVSNPAFRGLSGDFDPEAYDFTLQRRGLNAEEFENETRKDAARTLVQSAVIGGIPPAQQITDALLSYVGEQRSFAWAPLDATALETPLPAPTQAELTSFYDENNDIFTLPEIKNITYAWLRPENLLSAIDPDQEAIKNLYQERLDQYVQPERRLVERLVFESDEAAQAASERLTSGAIGFEALVTERGLSLSDIDLGDVTSNVLGDAAETVFSLAEPGDVSLPAPTNLGPAIFRMNGILNARETPFEDVEEELSGEYYMDRARRLVVERATNIDDMLAGGATLEELADETDMVLGALNWTPDTEEGIAAYDGFRSAASDLAPDDFAEIVELDDGSVFAMRLDEVVAPMLQPIDEVRDGVLTGWEAQATKEHLLEMAGQLGERISEGESFDAVGLSAVEETNQTRDAFVEATPPGFIAQVFELKSGEVRVIESENNVLVVQLNAVAPAETQTDDAAALREQVDGQVAQSIAQDVFASFARSVRAQAGLSRNQSALNAVHAQFP